MNNNDKSNIIDYFFTLLDTKTKPHYTHSTIYNQKNRDSLWRLFTEKQCTYEYCSGDFSLTSHPTWRQDVDTILTRAVDTNAWQMQRQQYLQAHSQLHINTTHQPQQPLLRALQQSFQQPTQQTQHHQQPTPLISISPISPISHT